MMNRIDMFLSWKRLQLSLLYRSGLLSLVLGLLLHGVVLAQSTHQTIPSTSSTTFNTTLQQFLRQEDGNRTADATANADWITSNCLATTSGTKVLPAFACNAYAKNGYYTTQTSTAVDLGASPGPACADTDLAWVIISDGLTAPGGNFVQSGSSRYWVDCTSTTQPATPGNATRLFLAMIEGGAVSRIVDTRSLGPTLPGQTQAHGAMTLTEELSRTLGDLRTGFVLNAGCTHGTSGTTTATMGACTAYVREIGPPMRVGYVLQPASLTFAYTEGDGTYWLIAHSDLSLTIASWTRVPGTHYLWRKSATQPALPDRAVWLLTTTVAANAISAVTDIAIRRITDAFTVATNIPVGPQSKWSIDRCDAPITVSITWTFKGQILAPPDCHIFGGAQTLDFTGTRTHQVYPEWFGAVGDGTTDDSTPMARFLTSKAPRMYVTLGKTYITSTGNSISNRVALTGHGTIKAHSSAVQEEKLITLANTADDSVIDLDCDGNSTGATCFFLDGPDRAHVTVTSTGLRATTGCSVQSAVRVAGGDGHVLTVSGHDFTKDTVGCAINPPPRVLSIGGTATNLRINIDCQNVIGACVVIGDARNVDITQVCNNSDDTCLYFTDPAYGVTIRGRSYNSKTCIVLRGTDLIVDNYACTNYEAVGIAIANVERVLISGSYFNYDSTFSPATYPSAKAIRTYADNTTSKDLKIVGSYFRGALGTTTEWLTMDDGVVNDLRLTDNQFEAHWVTGSTTQTLLKWAGTHFWATGNRFSVEDDTGAFGATSCGGGSCTFDITFTEPTNPSAFLDNMLVVPATSIGYFKVGVDPGNVIVRHPGNTHDIANAQYRDFSVIAGAKKWLHSAGEPTAMTLDEGDFVQLNSVVREAVGANCANVIKFGFLTDVGGAPGTQRPVYFCTP